MIKLKQFDFELSVHVFVTRDKQKNIINSSDEISHQPQGIGGYLNHLLLKEQNQTLQRDVNQYQQMLQTISDSTVK